MSAAATGSLTGSVTTASEVARTRTVYSPYDSRTILTERENDLPHLLAASPRRTFSRETDPAIITTVGGRGCRPGLL